jgi:hypothetical protein
VSEWEFSASIENDGDLCLEWYKSKGNVVTVCLNPNHGCVKGYPGMPQLGEVRGPLTPDGGSEHG